ncbi:MAG: MobA/MobL family protein [Lachnospiraceae bacterium]|nr:MobA/MobL family protein [Lachnospiraceae bacterium]
MLQSTSNKGRDAYGQWFADQGMCVDLAIHDPDKDIPNPHIHGMLTMRPIDRNGYFSKSKTRTVYRLDENGEKIPVPLPGTMLTAVRDPNGRWFAVPDFKYGGIQKVGKHGRKEYYREKIRVNDWDTKEFLFAARREWAEICNRYLSPEQQIDHRSLKEQGIDRTPAVHDGGERYYSVVSGRAKQVVWRTARSSDRKEGHRNEGSEQRIPTAGPQAKTRGKTGQSLSLRRHT